MGCQEPRVLRAAGPGSEQGLYDSASTRLWEATMGTFQVVKAANDEKSHHRGRSTSPVGPLDPLFMEALSRSFKDMWEETEESHSSGVCKQSTWGQGSAIGWEECLSGSLSGWEGTITHNTHKKSCFLSPCYRPGPVLDPQPAPSDLREGKRLVQGHTAKKWQTLAGPRCINSRARNWLSLTPSSLLGVWSLSRVLSPSHS